MNQNSTDQSSSLTWDEILTYVKAAYEKRMPWVKILDPFPQDYEELKEEWYKALDFTVSIGPHHRAYCTEPNLQIKAQIAGNSRVLSVEELRTKTTWDSEYIRRTSAEDLRGKAKDLLEQANRIERGEEDP